MKTKLGKRLEKDIAVVLRVPVNVLLALDRTLGDADGAIEAADVCTAFRKARPALERLAAAFDLLIPQVGRAIRFLLRVADAACPAET